MVLANPDYKWNNKATLTHQTPMHALTHTHTHTYIHTHTHAGEYFLTSDQKREQKEAAQSSQQMQRLEDRAKQREAAFVAPKVGVGLGLGVGAGTGAGVGVGVGVGVGG